MGSSDQGPVRAVRDVLGRAGIGGDTLLVLAKCTLAALLSWFVAERLLRMPTPTFAPFSAVLIVHGTVARSLSHSGRYLLAMLGGVALAGALSPLLGPSLVTFAVLVLLALLVGQWRLLGSQGPQVAVAAMFAYQSLVLASTWRSSFEHLADIAALIVLGSAVGVATNLLVLPPLRYRSAESGVRSLADRVRTEMETIADGVRTGAPQPDQAAEWARRVDELPNLVDQARQSVDQAAESLRYNPRRLLQRTTSFSGYRHTVEALSRVANQLHPITRSLTSLAEADGHDDAEQYLRSFADVLRSAAEPVRLLGDIHSGQDVREHRDELHRHIEQARADIRTLGRSLSAEHLEASDMPTYEGLHADSRRLVEDLAHADRELQGGEHDRDDAAR